MIPDCGVGFQQNQETSSLFVNALNQGSSTFFSLMHLCKNTLYFMHPCDKITQSLKKALRNPRFLLCILK